MTKSKHWLLGALTARNNAVVLKDSASNLLKSKNKHHGLFLLMTANEELEKAIWCILVYYRLATAQQITTVFKQHEHKIFLFHLIYNYLEFKNGEIYLKNTSLKKFDIKKFAQKQKTYVCDYKNMREN
ncbi:MAG: AbiV family abortive infection protein, partial [Candidatus Paceibacterota bacterium]